MLERVLPTLPETDVSDEQQALLELEAFLRPRVEEAEQGLAVEKSVGQIFEEAHREEGQ